MHRPNKESSELDIVEFDVALDEYNQSQDLVSMYWIYVPNFYCDYRYILGTKGKRPLITIGINPSTAEPNNLDPTLKSVERFALKHGYDSFIMFNVYAQRATLPDDMDTVFNEKLHKENMKAFDYVLKNAGNCPTIWAAWGTNIEKRSYLKKCLSDMIEIGKKYESKWVKMGDISKKGHPHHPLYLPKDLNFEDFDIVSYCKNLNI